MNFITVLALALGLSMDAFAVSICKGLSLKKAGFREACIVGLWFGIFQGLMPLVGYFLGISFRDLIASYDHWIAFGLLLVIGLNMIKEAIEDWKSTSSQKSASSINASNHSIPCVHHEDNGSADQSTAPCEPNGGISEVASPAPCEHHKSDGNPLAFRTMLTMAIATSIDALAAGLSLAMIGQNIWSASAVIALVTFLLSAAGVKVGSLFGNKYEAKAQLVGGVILILLGVKILVEHLTV